MFHKKPVGDIIQLLEEFFDPDVAKTTLVEHWVHLARKGYLLIGWFFTTKQTGQKV